jgi:hypothetical protein
VNHDLKPENKLVKTASYLGLCIVGVGVCLRLANHSPILLLLASLCQIEGGALHHNANKGLEVTTLNR